MTERRAAAGTAPHRWRCCQSGRRSARALGGGQSRNCRTRRRPTVAPRCVVTAASAASTPRMNQSRHGRRAAVRPQLGSILRRNAVPTGWPKAVHRCFNLRFGWREPCASKGRDIQISQVENFDNLRRPNGLSPVDRIVRWPGLSFSPTIIEPRSIFFNLSVSVKRDLQKPCVAGYGNAPHGESVVQTIFRRSRTSYEGYASLPADTLARVKCTACDYPYFRPFSCRTFHLCPSCDQKRTILYAEYLAEELLLELPHRQFVFTVPKILRQYFKNDKRLFGEVSRLIFELLWGFFNLAAQRRLLCGCVASYQSFGEFARFHPHWHVLVLEGATTNGADSSICLWGATLVC